MRGFSLVPPERPLNGAVRPPFRQRNSARAGRARGRDGRRWSRRCRRSVSRRPTSAPAMPGPKPSDRHVLARVVGAAPGRVVAVVGGEDHEVARLQPRRPAPAAAGRRLRAPRHSRRRRGGGRRACRNRRNWRRPDRRRRAASIAASVASNSAMSFGALRIVADAAMGEDVADLADRRTTCRPASVSRSRSVGSGGGTAKSRRLAVRLKVAVVSPTKGRAMTRPTLSGSTEPPRDRGRPRRAARGRNGSRARRSGRPNRPRCSRSACRSGCAPRRVPR